MRFHPGQPTIVYAFGCRVLEGLDIVNTQMRLAHRYFNTLVELEHWRREEADKLLSTMFPELAILTERWKLLHAQKKELTEQIKVMRGQQRKRVKVPPELRAQLNDLKARCKAAYAERKAARTQAFSSKRYQAAQKNLDAAWLLRAKQARKESGLYWGTYAAVERNIGEMRKGPPPEFATLPTVDKVTYRMLTFANAGTSPTDLPTSDDNRIAVQIQRGLDPVNMRTRQDRRLQDLGPREGFKNVRLIRLQLARNKHVLLGVKFHRELPEDARIKNIELVRKRVGTQTHWTVNFAMGRETGWAKPDTASSGTLAVNLGWRQMPVSTDDEPAMRVVTWLDDQGRTGEYRLPPKLLTDMKRADELRSIRDKNFDTIRPFFARWLKETTLTLPTWLTEVTTALSAWRSKERLDAIVRHWLRFEGDEVIYDTLRAWRSQDRHLRNWEQQLARRAANRRQDVYRTLAAQLRRQYRTLLIADVDWAGMRKNPLPDADTDTTRLARARMGQVAPGLCDKLLRASFAEVRGFPPEHLSQRCAACGELSGEADPEKLTHCCGHCGQMYDQDVNHCRNLLQQAGLLEAVSV